MKSHKMSAFALYTIKPVPLENEDIISSQNLVHGYFHLFSSLATKVYSNLLVWAALG